jgi:CelD/BcsL family acetyltransferase involved in cellulose biosynthesis
LNSRLSVSPPLPLTVHARRPLRELPFPVREQSHALFPKGRQALWHGARALNPQAGEEVLVPAYNCGSEVEALTNAGFACRFYEGDTNLEPNEEELDELLGPGVRCLYVIHYLGFPQDMPRWRRWCDARGLILIEDAAQAWLSSFDQSPLGSFGDLAIISLYKTFGLPDGAVLIARRPHGEPSKAADIGLSSLARRHAAWLFARSKPLAAVGARVAPEQAFLPAEAYSAYLRSAASDAFALGDPEKPASTMTRFLLPRVFRPDAVTRRRANYEELLQELGDLVAPQFARLPEGTSPFAFPIETPDKAVLLDRLAKNGVRALDLWPVPHPLVPVGRFPEAEKMRARVIALPVHQELVPGDVDHVIRAMRGRRPIRSDLRIEPVVDLDDIRDEWPEIAESSGNIFATWEWVSTWWRHFGGGRMLTVAACRSRSGKLVGILPLYRWSSRPLRVIRFIGNGASDELGPICHPSDRGAVTRALRRLLNSTALGWDLFIAEQLRATEEWQAFVGGTVVRREGNPVLRWPGGGWDEFLASRSSHLRKRVRYQERSLKRKHEVSYRLADDPKTLQEAMGILFALHRLRWGASGVAFEGLREAFHREFAGLALESGWLRLWILELDGQPASAWYGFRFAGADFYYQSGWDPRWEDLSVGSILVSHSIRDALDHGIPEYRFLRGGETFKYRLANEDRPLLTFGLSRGASGRTAVAAASLTQRVPWLRKALRSRLEA